MASLILCGRSTSWSTMLTTSGKRARIIDDVLLGSILRIFYGGFMGIQDRIASNKTGPIFRMSHILWYSKSVRAWKAQTAKLSSRERLRLLSLKNVALSWGCWFPSLLRNSSFFGETIQQEEKNLRTQGLGCSNKLKDANLFHRCYRIFGVLSCFSLLWSRTCAYLADHTPLHLWCPWEWKILNALIFSIFLFSLSCLAVSSLCDWQPILIKISHRVQLTILTDEVC